MDKNIARILFLDTINNYYTCHPPINIPTGGTHVSSMTIGARCNKSIAYQGVPNFRSQLRMVIVCGLLNRQVTAIIN